MNKKIFSTANFTMLFVNLVFIFCIIFNNHWNIDLTEKILFAVSAMIFAALAIVRFPLFIEDKNEQVNETFYSNKYENNISWLKKLIYILLTLEISYIPSIFSVSKLQLYMKGRICKFILLHNKPKFIHKFYDICLMIILAFLAIIFANILINVDIFSFLILAIIILILLERKNLLMYSLSTNVGQKDGVNINVVYPYSSSQVKIFKYYGITFLNTVLITQDAFRLNPVIKNYVVMHEMGHIKNKCISLIRRITVTFNVFFVTLMPCILHDCFGINKPFILFLPLILFCLYTMTIGYYITEKSELLADKFAVNILGYEKCIEALNLLNKENPTFENKNPIRKLFIRDISFNRRIKFVNDYAKKNED